MRDVCSVVYLSALATCAQARAPVGRPEGAAATDPCNVIRTENPLHVQRNWGKRDAICGDSSDRTVTPKLLCPYEKNTDVNSRNCNAVGARSMHRQRRAYVCICMQVRRPEQQACTVHAG